MTLDAGQRLLIDRADLHRTRIAARPRQPRAATAAAGPGAAGDRALLAHRQQHHLRRLRRGHEVLAVLPGARCRLGLPAGVGLCRWSPNRRPKAWPSAAASGATFRRARTWWCNPRGWAPRASSMPPRTGRNSPRSTTSTAGATPTPPGGPDAEGLQAVLQAAVHHLVPDRRLPGRQRLFRRAATAAVQRVQQDRVRHRLLPGAAPRHARRTGGRRPHLGRQPGLHALARRLRRACAPTAR